MAIEEQLRDRLRKVEALFFGATTDGERGAAGAAVERLKAKLAEVSRQDHPVELSSGCPTRGRSVSSWRCAGDTGCGRTATHASATRRSLRAPRRFFETVVWRQFSDLHTDLWQYFEQTTGKLIREAVHADTTDAEVVAEPLGHG